MLRDAPLVDGEYYHVFNRGAHKAKIFTSQRDYERFLLLMYLANTTKPMVLRDKLKKYKGRSYVSVIEEEQQENALVGVMSYALMPNHFHMVLRQREEGGITTFIKKLGTAYSMYFNLTHEHSGVLFQGRFQSRLINNDAYFRYIFAYVHLNPVSLVEPGWEEEGLVNLMATRKFINAYEYSSFYDYSVGTRPIGKILSQNEAPDFLLSQNDLEDLLEAYKNNTEDRPLYNLKA